MLPWWVYMDLSIPVINLPQLIILWIRCLDAHSDIQLPTSITYDKCWFPSFFVTSSWFVHLPVMLMVYHTNHGNVLIWGLSSKGASCSPFPADLGRSVLPRFLPSKLVFTFNSFIQFFHFHTHVALQCLLLMHRLVAVRNQCEAYRYYTCLHSTVS